jgi:PE family
MSYLVAVPDVLASAVTDVEGIGSSLTTATAAAAAPTTAVAAAGADEVSTAIAALSNSGGVEGYETRNLCDRFHSSFR